MSCVDMSLCLFDDLAVSSCCISHGKTFTPPSWAVPMNEPGQAEGVAIHVIKDGEVINTLKLDDARKYTIFGRCPIASMGNCGVTLQHISVSRTHASVIRSSDGTVYVVDLGSSHGTCVNGARINPFVAVPLINRSTIRFGQSSRQYLVRMFSTSLPSCEVDDEAGLNTLLNCMVGFKTDSDCGGVARQAVVVQQQPPKLERRVSFSCVAPEIILIQDGATISTTPLSDTCMFASPPEIKFRKSPKVSIEEDGMELEPNKRFREVLQ